MPDQRLIDDLTVGTVEVLPAGALAAKLAERRARGPAAARQARRRPHRARHPPGAHGRPQQAAPVPGRRSRRRAHHRRLHGAHRRSLGPLQDPPPPRSRGHRRQRAHLPGAGSAHPRRRSGQARDAAQRRVARPAHHRGDLRAGRDDHGGAHPRARRFRQALGGAPADLDARDALSAGPGLRLRRGASRHRARRHRPEVQPVHGSRPAAVLRPGAPGRDDPRHPARHRRRRAHEQVDRQLHRRDRGSARRLRQGHEHPRRGDHDLLPPAHRPSRRRDRRPRTRAGRRRAETARPQGPSGSRDPDEAAGRRRRQAPPKTTSTVSFGATRRPATCRSCASRPTT